METNEQPTPRERNPYYDLDDSPIGSQDPALQLTLEDNAAVSRYIQAVKRGLSHEEAKALAFGGPKWPGSIYGPGPF